MAKSARELELMMIKTTQMMDMSKIRYQDLVCLFFEALCCKTSIALHMYPTSKRAQNGFGECYRVTFRQVTNMT